ncbi:26863_t:CDS:2, partial [Dentiscutata erythropus]
KIYKNIIITMSLDSLIDAFEAYENSNSTAKLSGNNDIESDTALKDSIQFIDEELLSDIQLKNYFEQPLIQLTKHNIVTNIQYYLTFIEYSTTANESIAHIFCIEKWDNSSFLFKDV